MNSVPVGLPLFSEFLQERGISRTTFYRKCQEAGIKSSVREDRLTLEAALLFEVPTAPTPVPTRPDPLLRDVRLAITLAQAANDHAEAQNQRIEELEHDLAIARELLEHILRIVTQPTPAPAPTPRRRMETFIGNAMRALPNVLGGRV